MDTTSIRNFAVTARERLIAGVDERLNMLGFDADGNVSEENREGKPVRYLPLYMLPLVAKELSKGSLDGVVARPPTW